MHCSRNPHELKESATVFKISPHSESERGRHDMHSVPLVRSKSILPWVLGTAGWGAEGVAAVPVCVCVHVCVRACVHACVLI